jgi:O-antigen/teichoic acid export membrane protein
VILLQIFPILLLTNLVDGTVLPLRSLGGTVRRLAAQAGYFAAFQITVALVTALVLIVVDAMHSWHWVAAVAAAGPMAATWFMYYGHWLGRLGRQLAELD